MSSDLVNRCVQCGTELSRDALVCPACQALVHAAELKALAARAEAFAQDGALEAATQQWQRALELLPPTTAQYAAIERKLRDLGAQRDGVHSPIAAAERTRREGGSTWRQIWAGGGALVLLLLGKGKFLLLGLTKLKTFVSMFAFFGVYWSTWGWPVALGLVVGIYIHEMGHVASLQRHGIGATAPMFIPGLGAFILSKQHITDPRVDAAVGLAGPLWGLGAALAAYAVYRITDAPIWMAIAHLNAFINLFNLIPVWQLDGSRGFHALDAPMRWVVVAAAGVMWWLTRGPMELVIAGVGAWRAWTTPREMQGHVGTLVTFVGLVAVLGWLSAVA